MKLALPIRRYAVRVQRPVTNRELAEHFQVPIEEVSGRVAMMTRRGLMKKTEHGYIVLRESESGKRNDLR